MLKLGFWNVCVQVLNANLSSANLALFDFTGYLSGGTSINLGGGNYEVVPLTPVPEASTYAAGAPGLLAVSYDQRRRLRKMLLR